jgi:beta-galactosidase GanA
MYMPGMIQVQKDLASALLNHVNPYSGRAYKNDPGIIALELHNESSMNTPWGNGKFNTYIASSTLYTKYMKPLEDLWEAWAQKKYGTVAAMNTAWSSNYNAFSDLSVPSSTEANTMNVQKYKDWIDFMYSVEKNYNENMYNYYRNTIGVTTLIYDTQADYNVPWVHEKMETNMI